MDKEFSMKCRNSSTIRFRPIRPKEVIPASSKPKSFNDKHGFKLFVHEIQDFQDIPEDEFDLLDWETQRALTWFNEGQEYFQLYEKEMEKNKALEAENQRLREEIAMLNFLPFNAITQSPATKKLRMIESFFRRTRLFFILLDLFNQIIKHRCKIDDGEVEGCGSVLRKIFELVTSTGTDIRESTLTIPDLDFKVYCSKKEFEHFSNKVGEWAFDEQKLHIPGTHFIIGEMRKFTSKKPTTNGGVGIVYNKFTMQIFDSSDSQKEVFMIDIMNIDGSNVFQCDFLPNSLVASPKQGIFSRDPLRPHAPFDFSRIIRDIMHRNASCMTIKDEGLWKYDVESMLFLSRQLKMENAGYTMHGGPIMKIEKCPILYDVALGVSLFCSNCKRSTGESIGIFLSISASVDLFVRKQCPMCREGNFNFFECSESFPKKKISDPFSLTISDEEPEVRDLHEHIREMNILRERVREMNSKHIVLFKFSEKMMNALLKLIPFLNNKIYGGDQIDNPVDGVIIQEQIRMEDAAREEQFRIGNAAREEQFQQVSVENEAIEHQLRQIRAARVARENAEREVLSYFSRGSR